MPRALLSALLDGCLLTDAQMARGKNAWAKFKDPFAPWQMNEELRAEHPHALAAPLLTAAHSLTTLAPGVAG